MRVNVDLQDDFSLDQTLSLYLLDTLPLLDAESPDYALDVLTLVESILENPELILRKQLDRIKDRAVAEMKADGVEYDQRMEELEKLEYPKPQRDFIYDTFNAFADRHPWVGEENIRPKSIAREMFENFRSFAEYVRDYELQRSEGLLLRHLNGVYKVLSQTVPDGAKTDEVTRDGALPADAAAPGRLEPRGRVGADARPQLPAVAPAAAAEELRPPGAGKPRRDITRDAKAFTAAIRTRIFTFLRAWAIGDHAAALAARSTILRPPTETDGERVDRGAAASALEAYRVDHEPSASIPRRATSVTPTSTPSDDKRTWRVQQMLVDPALHNDWMAEFEVDLAASREANQPVLWLRGIGPIG